MKAKLVKESLYLNEEDADAEDVIYDADAEEDNE